MEYKYLDDKLSVAPQIQPEDISYIVNAGFKSIVCNRPDDEEPGQTSWSRVEAAARAAGIPFVNIPVISGQITAQNVRDMKAAVAELPKPVFAYCRSGARCSNLYQMVLAMPD